MGVERPTCFSSLKSGYATPPDTRCSPLQRLSLPRTAPTVRVFLARARAKGPRAPHAASDTSPEAACVFFALQLEAIRSARMYRRTCLYWPSAAHT
jgi:hypothetical protein